jgi:hypothetical protein
VFDGDVVAGHDDALDEQAHEALAALEVEPVEAGAQRGGKGLEVVAEAIEACAVELGDGKLFEAVVRGSASRFEMLTPGP